MILGYDDTLDKRRQYSRGRTIKYQPIFLSSPLSRILFESRRRYTVKGILWKISILSTNFIDS